MVFYVAHMFYIEQMQSFGQKFRMFACKDVVLDAAVAFTKL